MRLDLAHIFAVPGTGRRTRQHGLFRSPRHIAVERVLAGFGLRGEKIPPNAWDDILRHAERSWKAHRDTQWRPGLGDHRSDRR